MDRTLPILSHGVLTAHLQLFVHASHQMADNTLVRGRLRHWYSPDPRRHFTCYTRHRVDSLQTLGRYQPIQVPFIVGDAVRVGAPDPCGLLFRT